MSQVLHHYIIDLLVDNLFQYSHVADKCYVKCIIQAAKLFFSSQVISKAELQQKMSHQPQPTIPHKPDETEDWESGLFPAVISCQSEI